MTELIFRALAAGLEIWEHKERNKYIRKMINLKKDWYEEYNKDPSDRSDAILDNVEFELRILVEAFASKIGTKDTKNK